jgi:histidinol-phosphate aminotransferase
VGLKVRKVVEALPKYTPAKSIDSVKREFGIENVIKLAANENTLGFSPKVKEALKDVVSYYPDMEVTALRGKVAERYGIDPEKIIFGNGSFELLFLVGLVFLEQGDESIVAEPSFNWYKNVTLMMGGSVVEVPLNEFKVDLEAIKAAITEKTKIIWLCNPNNPTGTMLTEEELTQFLDSIPEDIIVVLDEAYCDFVTEEGYPDSIKLLERYPNIVVLRTFSKLYGLAFFRLGYGFASKEIIDYMNRVKLPINTNGAAQLAALAAIDDDEFNQKSKENVLEGLKLYYDFCEKRNLKYVRSNNNFILFDLGRESAPVVEELLHQGIMIRDGAEFGYPTMVRVSIGTPEENQEALTRLSEILDR